jgi:hypothetical protein
VHEHVWFGFTGSGRILQLTLFQGLRLREQVPTHWKAFRYINGRSLEVGGARIAKTREEALKRKWYDIAEFFFPEGE